MNSFKSFFSLLSLFLFIIVFQNNFVEAQNYESPYACPNFEFLKNMQKGDQDEDVYVLQQMLNLDKRTVIAYSGPGSRGKETALFGSGTRESLKRFQALFIEYIEVADGKFNTKTRTVMNNVCKGPFFTGMSKNPYDISSSTTHVSPVIGISGPTEAEIDTPFRAYFGSSVAIKTPTLTGLIIEGATAADVRKTSSTTFSFLVTPNADNKGEIKLQMEADSIEDLFGNKNEIASNEWVVTVIGISTSTAVNENLDTSVLDSILSSIPTAATTDCSKVSSVSVTDYNNPCYGKAPMTNAQSDSGGEKKDDTMMQMMMGIVQGLLKSLTGGGGQNGGGSAGGDSVCACSGEPTTMLMGKSGPSGRAKMSKNPRTGSDYVSQGKIMPATGICGQSRSPKCQGGCCNPQSDATGMIVPYDIAPGPFWSGVGGAGQR